MSLPNVVQFPSTESTDPMPASSRVVEPCSEATDADRPFLVSAPQLARLLGISVRTLWRMDAAGQIPRAGQLMKMKRWNRREIERWLDARKRDGTYPDRREWELLEISRRGVR